MQTRYQCVKLAGCLLAVSGQRALAPTARTSDSHVCHSSSSTTVWVCVDLCVCVGGVSVVSVVPHSERLVFLQVGLP